MARRGIFERRANSGTWSIDYRDAERVRHREKIGGKSAALEALASRLEEIKKGTFIPPHQGARLTFREVATAAMTQKKLRLAPLSYKTDRERLGHLLPLIGDVPAEQLTPARIEETLATLIHGGIKKSTANRYHALASSIFKFAVNAGKLSFNPLSKVKRFPESDKRERFLSREEEVALRKAIADPDDQAIPAAVCQAHIAEFDLALNSGMRRGEQFFAKWKDIDYDRKLLTVTGKSGRRHVRLNKESLRALFDLNVGIDEYICPDTTGKETRDTRQWFENAVKQARVANFRWHDIRHTFASRLIAAGVGLPEVQELLGHKDIKTTMRYAHLTISHLQAAVEKMNEEAPA